MTLLNKDKIIIGTWALGDKYWGEQSHSDSLKTLHRAIFLGFKSFDTAIAYGNGKSEQILGQQFSNIPELKISSKSMVRPVISFEKNFNLSIKRLNRQNIETYFLHWPSTTTPIEPILDFLATKRTQGVINNIGLSNFDLPKLKKALEVTKIDIIQNSFSPLWTNDLVLFNFCKKNSIVTQGYSPLAQGLLTGKYNSNTPFVTKDMRDRCVFFSPNVLTFLYPCIDRLNDICNQKKILLSNQALLWSLEYIDQLVVGCRTRKQVENLSHITQSVLDLEIKELLTELSYKIKAYLPQVNNIFNHSY